MQVICKKQAGLRKGMRRQRFESQSNPEGHTQLKRTVPLRGESSDHLNARRAEGKALQEGISLDTGPSSKLRGGENHLIRQERAPCR